MGQITGFLMNIQKIMKLHDGMLKEICVKYQLTPIEAKIISFLYNNPGKDTATDIVELRMLQKGNVSAAVETLVCKSLLVRQKDPEDRRKVHLALTPDTAPILQSLELLQDEFREKIFAGFTEEEKHAFYELNEKLQDTLQNVGSTDCKNEV